MDKLERPDEEFFYPAPDLRFFEEIWGEGFISPGGSGEVSKILEHIDLTGKTILDIGCGMGGVDLLLVNNHGAKKVVGVDVEAPVLEKARNYASEAGLSDQISFVQIEPGRLDFEDNAFDVVFTKDALLHVDDKEALFSEVYRLLKPNGLFVGSDWLRGEYSTPSEAMKKYDLLSYGEFYMVTAGFYEAVLNKTGFQHISFVDRNSWYLQEVKTELESIYALKDEIIRTVGKENYQNSWEDFWLTLVEVLKTGELRPTHFSAIKS